MKQKKIYSYQPTKEHETKLALGDLYKHENEM